MIKIKEIYKIRAREKARISPIIELHKYCKKNDLSIRINRQRELNGFKGSDYVYRSREGYGQVLGIRFLK